MTTFLGLATITSAVNKIQTFIMRIDGLTRDLEHLGVPRDYRYIRETAIPPSTVDNAVQFGLNWIYKQIDNRFPELEHAMLSVGLPNSPPWQVGHVFPLSVLCNRLLDIREGGLTIDADQLNTITNNILAEKGPGPFKYFPNMEELPPDVDDLSEVLQVLSRQGALSRYVNWRSDVALVHQATTGGISTWIYDSVPEMRLRYDKWIKEIWGEGSDLEVESNYAYALWLVGLKTEVATVVASILDKVSQGGWNARWYADCGYTEFCLTRLLTSIGMLERPLAQKLLQRAEELLERGEQESNPLMLAFVIRVVQALSCTWDLQFSAQLSDLKTHLLEWQRPNGSWSATPFIAMPMKLPGGKVRHLYYQSATLTTAYVLSALCSA